MVEAAVKAVAAVAKAVEVVEVRVPVATGRAQLETHQEGAEEIILRQNSRGLLAAVARKGHSRFLENCEIR